MGCQGSDLIAQLKEKNNLTNAERNIIKDYDARSIADCFNNSGELLKHLLDINNMKQASLKGLASQGVVSELINGKRQLTLKHIIYLAEEFSVSPLIFLEKFKLK